MVESQPFVGKRDRPNTSRCAVAHLRPSLSLRGLRGNFSILEAGVGIEPA
jgi:hypothetical protein